MICLRRSCLLAGLLIPFIIMCCGFGCHAPPTIDKDANMVVVVSRSLPSGKLQAFKIDDPGVVEKMRQAVQEDLRHPDNPKIDRPISVNHILVFRNKDGNTTSFSILGDHFIVVDSRRYDAKRTIGVLRNAHHNGTVVPIDAEEAKRLVPDMRDYPIEEPSTQGFQRWKVN
jgi:hypothetical protein